jgi:hypothetical protein
MTDELENPIRLVRNLRMAHGDAVSVVTQVSEWPTSKEMAGANPLLDEWVLLARAIADMITNWNAYELDDAQQT